MARSNNLDTVAPDDQVLTPNSDPVTPSSQPVKPALPKTKKQKPQPPPSSEDNKSYRQKVYDILGHTTHPLSSMLIKPHVFSFIEQDKDEEIVLVLRQHWFTNVSWILATIFMVFLPGILAASPLYLIVPNNMRFIFTLFWYLVTIAFAFEKFLSWYFNVYIITEERVIDIDFNNLLNKKFSEAKLSMIQDVTSHVRGLGQTMFGYGNILIQTASEINQLTFEKVPNPGKIIKVLQQLRLEEEQETLEGRVN